MNQESREILEFALAKEEKHRANMQNWADAALEDFKRYAVKAVESEAKIEMIKESLSE